MGAPENTPAAPWEQKTRVRWLVPETTQIFEGTFSLLHCAVKNDTLYRGVFAVMMFPISAPGSFISLRYTDSEEKDREIGVIRHLDAFPEEQQQLVHASLVKHYYEQEITRVYEVKFEYGLLFFDVETVRSREQFTTYWAYDRAQEYGVNGKLILDVHNNRYLVPDVARLPAADQARFTRFIYW